jgi:hypothetical protein
MSNNSCRLNPALRARRIGPDQNFATARSLCTPDRAVAQAQALCVLCVLCGKKTKTSATKNAKNTKQTNSQNSGRTTHELRRTSELSDAGGPARSQCQQTWPAHVRSSDLVRRPTNFRPLSDEVVQDKRNAVHVKSGISGT